MLRSPLLSPVSADKGRRLMMQHVLKSMPPQVHPVLHFLYTIQTCSFQHCLTLVCPQLSGWVSSSDGEPVPLALSPESIYNSGQKIFVLDSFINVS